jgi:PST family polysaccharide transporter
MEERAIRGVPWTIATYAGSRLVGVLSTIALAHLLVPEEFGVVAIALIAVSMFNALRDFGLAGTLVLRTDVDGTVFTLMIGFGLALTALLAALAVPIADFFGEPQLDDVLIVISPAVAISAVTWFYEAIMQRELEFRPRFLAVTAQSVVYAAVAITLAALGAGVWSLVVGQLLGAATLAATLFALAPYRVRPAWDPRDARRALSTGAGFLVQGGLAFVQQNFDYLVVGRVLGAAQTGYYSVAYRISELPYLGLVDPVAKVTFPGFARMRARGEEVVPIFVEILRLVAVVACPIGVLISALADPFTRALFGDDWLPMIGPLAVLGIWAAIRPFPTTIAALFNAVGRAGLVGRISTLVLVPLIPGIIIAAHAGGITAVAWLIVADVLLSTVLFAVSARRVVAIPFAVQWRAVAPVAAAGLISWLAARGLITLIEDAPATVRLLLGAGVGLLAYLGTIVLVSPGLLGRAMAQVRRTIARGTEPETETAVSRS